MEHFLSRLSSKTIEEEDISMTDIVHTLESKSIQFSEEKLKPEKKNNLTFY